MFKVCLVKSSLRFFSSIVLTSVFCSFSSHAMNDDSSWGDAIISPVVLNAGFGSFSSYEMDEDIINNKNDQPSIVISKKSQTEESCNVNPPVQEKMNDVSEENKKFVRDHAPSYDSQKTFSGEQNQMFTEDGLPIPNFWHPNLLLAYLEDLKDLSSNKRKIIGKYELLKSNKDYSFYYSPCLRIFNSFSEPRLIILGTYKTLIPEFEPQITTTSKI